MKTAFMVLVAAALGLLAVLQDRHVPPTKTTEFVQGSSPQQTLTVEEAAEFKCQCQEKIVVVADMLYYREELWVMRRVEQNRRMQEIEARLQKFFLLD